MTKLLTMQEAADTLSVSLATLYRWAQSKRIPTVRIGYRTVRVDPADLARLIEDLKMGGQND